MWKLLPPLNSTLRVLIPTGVLLQPPCSYHIDRCPAPSRGHSSPGWKPCAGASGRPRTPGQPLWSGSAPGWWTSSGPWCKSSPASPCVVGGSWGCSSLRVSKRITLLFFFFPHPSSMWGERKTFVSSDTLCLKKWRNLYIWPVVSPGLTSASSSNVMCVTSLLDGLRARRPFAFLEESHLRLTNVTRQLLQGWLPPVGDTMSQCLWEKTALGLSYRSNRHWLLLSSAKDIL